MVLLIAKQSPYCFVEICNVIEYWILWNYSHWSRFEAVGYNCISINSCVLNQMNETSSVGHIAIKVDNPTMNDVVMKIEIVMSISYDLEPIDRIIRKISTLVLFVWYTTRYGFIHLKLVLKTINLKDRQLTADMNEGLVTGVCYRGSTMLSKAVVDSPIDNKHPNLGLFGGKLLRSTKKHYHCI